MEAGDSQRWHLSEGSWPGLVSPALRSGSSHQSQLILPQCPCLAAAQAQGTGFPSLPLHWAGIPRKTQPAISSPHSLTATARKVPTFQVDVSAWRHQAPCPLQAWGTCSLGWATAPAGARPELACAQTSGGCQGGPVPELTPSECAACTLGPCTASRDLCHLCSVLCSDTPWVQGSPAHFMQPLLRNSHSRSCVAFG